MQLFSKQSPSDPHLLPSRHLFSQNSPQSLSDSAPLKMPSKQVEGAHTRSLQFLLWHSLSKRQVSPVSWVCCGPPQYPWVHGPSTQSVSERQENPCRQS